MRQSKWVARTKCEVPPVQLLEEEAYLAYLVCSEDDVALQFCPTLDEDLVEFPDCLL